MSMKLTATNLWRTRAWPGPGAPTSTCSNRRTSGPPVSWMRMAWAMVCLLGFLWGGSGAERVRVRKAGDQGVGQRPGAVAGSGVQVADLAQVHHLAAPVGRQLLDAVEAGERV